MPAMQIAEAESKCRTDLPSLEHMLIHRSVTVIIRPARTVYGLKLAVNISIQLGGNQVERNSISQH
jgi:hypothetical protein